MPHEVARREAIVRAEREAVLGERGWVGLADGAPIGTGVPRADWLSSRTPTPQEARAAANCALVTLADGSLATGVHLRLTHRGHPLSALVTAAHVMPTAAAARRARAVFTHGRERTVKCDPESLFHVVCGTDIVVCALRHAVDAPPVRCCHKRGFRAGNALHIVQHPNGSQLVSLPGRVAMASASTQYFLHTADTLEGSSGAPIFDARWRLAGVHVGTTDVLVRQRAVPYNEGCHIAPLLHALGERGYALASTRPPPTPPARPGRAASTPPRRASTRRRSRARARPS
jgi:hypothetical protein